MLGSSGAGKSTLTNTLLGAAAQDTGAVRENDGRGMHTTTARSLHRLAGGACVIDTPGVRTLRPDTDAATLAASFDDIEALSGRCRFRDCRHHDEPGCAVREGIDPDRLRNYQKLLRESRRDTIGALERQRTGRGLEGARAGDAGLDKDQAGRGLKRLVGGPLRRAMVGGLRRTDTEGRRCGACLERRGAGEVDPRAGSGCGKLKAVACSSSRSAAACTLGGAYSASPRIGWPIACRCTRNWCERPVTGSARRASARPCVAREHAVARQRRLALIKVDDLRAAGSASRRSAAGRSRRHRRSTRPSTIAT